MRRQSTWMALSGQQLFCVFVNSFGTFEGQGFCELFLLTLRAFLLTHSSCGNAYLKSGHFIDGKHDMLQNK